jgi:hypothetical protein
MTTSLIPESVFAAQIGIPRASLTKWRTSGQLVKEQHYQRDEHQAFVITAEGQAEVMRLAGIESPPAAPSRVPVSVQCAGVMPRILRCKQEDGVICSVRLTGPRVFASQFRKHDKLEVLPTEHSGIFEYDGQRPKRIRI